MPSRHISPHLATSPHISPHLPDQVNSLEQLCINFTNEKLQATFNQAIFHAAMEENAEEDVNVEVCEAYASPLSPPLPFSLTFSPLLSPSLTFSHLLSPSLTFHDRLPT